MRLALLVCAASLLTTASGFAETSNHPQVPHRIPPASTESLRTFAVMALRHLNGPAQRPFIRLLRTLPPRSAQPGVTISAKATKNMQCSGGTCTPTAAVANLNVSDLTRLLGDESVTIATTGQAPDVFVEAPFSWTSSNGLTLQAIGNIVVNKAVRDNGTAPLALIYNATGAGGMLSFGSKGHISFSGTGNALTINGQGYILANTLRLLAQLIVRNPGGNFALSASYNAKKDGIYTETPINATLNGNLNGLGNTLSNLRVESGGQGNNGGLIVATEAGSTFDDVRVTRVNIAFNPFAASCVGGVAGTNNGTMSGNSFSGTVSAFSSGDYAVAGGIVCQNNGSIDHAVTSGQVNATSTAQYAWAGGITGLDYGSTDTSNSSATVAADGNGNSYAGACSIAAGGLYGYNIVNGGTVTNSWATGAVTGTDNSAVNNACAGGLVGVTEGAIENSYATGPATALVGSSPGYVAGGLVGLGFGLGGTITTSWASGTASAYNVGGLVGINYASIDNSSSSGAVTGPAGATAGGFLGWWATESGSTVTNSSSTGAVTAGSGSYIGGFVGFDNSSGYFSNDGWCTNSSGVTDTSQGAGNIANDPGITAFSC